MQSHELAKFITETMQGLWPKWSPGKAELAIWKKALRNYDAVITLDAANLYWQQGGQKYDKPLLSKLTGYMRDLSRRKKGQTRTVYTITGIKNSSKINYTYVAFVPANITPEFISGLEAEALRNAEEIKNLYKYEQCVIQHHLELPAQETVAAEKEEIPF